MEFLPSDKKSKTEGNESASEVFPLAPEGWLTLTGVCNAFWPNRKFRGSPVTVFDSDSGEYKGKTKGSITIPYYEIKVFIENYKKSNPEYFDIYKTKGGNAEHFSPELIKIIGEHFGRSVPKEAKKE